MEKPKNLGTSASASDPSVFDPFKSSYRQHIHKILGTAFLTTAGGALLFSLQKFDFQSISRTFEEISVLEIVSLLALALVQVGFQAGRLWCLLPHAVDIGFLSFFSIHVRGQLINQVIPARAGDIVKAHILKQSANAKKSLLTLSELFGSVLVTDKIADLTGLLVLLLLFSPSWVSNLMSGLDDRLTKVEFAFAVLLILMVTATGVYAYKRRLNEKIKSLANGFLNGLRQSFEAEKFITAFGLALGSWLTEVAILILMTYSLKLDLEFSQALVVLGVLNIGIAVPVSFANLGTYEGALAFGLSQFRIPIASALACAIIYHFIQLTALMIPYVVEQAFKMIIGSMPAFRVEAKDKAKAINYYGARSQHYTETTSKGFLHFLRSREQNAIIKFLELPSSSGKTLLDVGSGGGRYSLIAKAAGMRVTAVDVNEGMIAQLRGKVDHCYVADIERLEENERFDKVLCIGVLDFVVNPKLALDILSKLVKPGGRLILLVPRNSWIFGSLYRLEKKLFGFQVNLFHEHHLRDWADAQGLTVTGVDRPLPHNIVIAFDRLTKR